MCSHDLCSILPVIHKSIPNIFTHAQSVLVITTMQINHIRNLDKTRVLSTLTPVLVSPKGD